jgi:hypothetical protein
MSLLIPADRCIFIIHAYVKQRQVQAGSPPQWAPSHVKSPVYLHSHKLWWK